MPKESWTLKLDRAEEHLKEFEGEISKYAGRHPYMAEPIPKTKSHPDVRHSRLRFVQQPDRMTAVILGDVIHNMRSSLDHLRCGLVPSTRRNKLLYFPIETVDIWEKDELGAYVVADDEARKGYCSAVKGMAPGAQAIIESAQPYKMGDKAASHPFALLNSLDNADKHRHLVVLATALSDITMTISAKGYIAERRLPGVAKDGAPLPPFRIRGGASLPESEVYMQLRGTPHVTVDVGLSTPGEVVQVFSYLLQALRECVAALEPFVKP